MVVTEGSCFAYQWIPTTGEKLTHLKYGTNHPKHWRKSFPNQEFRPTVRVLPSLLYNMQTEWIETFMDGDPGDRMSPSNRPRHGSERKEESI